MTQIFLPWSWSFSQVWSFSKKITSDSLKIRSFSKTLEISGFGACLTAILDPKGPGFAQNTNLNLPSGSIKSVIGSQMVCHPNVEHSNSSKIQTVTFL